MELNKKSSVSDTLRKYDYFAKEDDYIEITEWANGEGWDINIENKQPFTLTRGELEAINYLTKVLEYGDKE